MAESSAKSQAIFEEAGRRDFIWRWRTFRSGSFLREPGRIRDGDAYVTCLRSVQMKPEHLAWRMRSGGGWIPRPRGLSIPRYRFDFAADERSTAPSGPSTGGFAKLDHRQLPFARMAIGIHRCTRYPAASRLLRCSFP